jgi:two-component system sensor histidine kinase UhpB
VSDEAALCLYRITQEGLRNIGQHARAHRVHLTLRSDGGNIILTLNDVGRGFDPQRARKKGGLGLISMEERARLVGGTFTVTSAPGRGTSINVSIPEGIKVSQKEGRRK